MATDLKISNIDASRVLEVETWLAGTGSDIFKALYGKKISYTTYDQSKRELTAYWQDSDVMEAGFGGILAIISFFLLSLGIGAYLTLTGTTKVIEANTDGSILKNLSPEQQAEYLKQKQNQSGVIEQATNLLLVGGGLYLASELIKR